MSRLLLSCYISFNRAFGCLALRDYPGSVLETLKSTLKVPIADCDPSAEPPSTEASCLSGILSDTFKLFL